MTTETKRAYEEYKRLLREELQRVRVPFQTSGDDVSQSLAQESAAGEGDEHAEKVRVRLHTQ